MSHRVRIGMVGGGQGAFIGAIHRIALRMDDAFELVAGCFGRDPENTRVTGEQLRNRCGSLLPQLGTDDR